MWGGEWVVKSGFKVVLGGDWLCRVLNWLCRIVPALCRVVTGV